MFEKEKMVIIGFKVSSKLRQQITEAAKQEGKVSTSDYIRDRLVADLKNRNLF